MFFVKIINKTDKNDIFLDRGFDTQIDAQKYYNKIKMTASANSDDILRAANEILEQTELRYRDVILYLYENEKRISKFMIG